MCADNLATLNSLPTNEHRKIRLAFRTRISDHLNSQAQTILAIMSDLDRNNVIRHTSMPQHAIETRRKMIGSSSQPPRETNKSNGSMTQAQMITSNRARTVRQAADDRGAGGRWDLVDKRRDVRW